MGSCSSKKNVLSTEETHYSKDELKVIDNDFSYHSSNGKQMSKDGFRDAFLGLVSNGSNNLFTDQITKAFSISSQIDHNQFAIGFSKCSTSNRDEKLKFVFSIYDIDNDGYLSRAEFLQMLECFFEVNRNHFGKSFDTHDESTRYIDRFFKEVSPLMNDRISYNEYKTHSLKNQLLASVAGIFWDVRKIVQQM
ncbi:calcium binding protein [Anaeramoeba ignava]|uniref:Calcium binding protein n=1 Tax=Anaeramoeba ignava TaxID=1746090 RepID=A0A9Q0LRY3_ANAIG|nr:calcium binding protein [Anaeramoeba ignava]|eukprot:Anaeramoba_ignava/a479803_60.p1 GENE.a479803_60~~a479803_60.p1  ORF type:complete len:193 (+),score=37.99 a479803_60:71-649(+)